MISQVSNFQFQLKSKHLSTIQPMPDDLLKNILKSPNFTDNRIDCKYLHNNSCLYFNFQRFLVILKRVFGIFLIAHSAPYLFHKRKQFRADFKKCLKEIFVKCWRTFVFLFFHLNGSVASFCFFKNHFNGFRILPTLIMNFACTGSIFYDSPKRVEELTLYWLIRYLDVMWSYTKKILHINKDVPYFNEFVFSASIGVFLSIISDKKYYEISRHSYKSISDSIIGKQD